MDKGDCSFESQGASNDPQLPQLVEAAVVHLISTRCNSEISAPSSNPRLYTVPECNKIQKIVGAYTSILFHRY